MAVLTGLRGLISNFADGLLSNSHMARKKMGGLTYSPIPAFILLNYYKYLIYKEEQGRKECRHSAVKFKGGKWFRRDKGGLLKAVPHDQARSQAGLKR